MRRAVELGFRVCRADLRGQSSAAARAVHLVGEEAGFARFAAADQRPWEAALKLWQLVEDRVEEGPISNEQFRAILIAAVVEFEAEEARRQSEGRRGTTKRRSRGRPVEAPVSELDTPVSNDVEEPPQC